jgi:hypothetical protein
MTCQNLQACIHTWGKQMMAYFSVFSESVACLCLGAVKINHPPAFIFWETIGASRYPKPLELFQNFIKMLLLHFCESNWMIEVLLIDRESMRLWGGKAAKARVLVFFYGFLRCNVCMFD